MNRSPSRLPNRFPDAVATSTSTDVSSWGAARVLRNTYLLLAMTLLFSAATASLAMAMDMPALPWWLSLAGMLGLLFLVMKTAHSAAGLASVFAFTGFVGLQLGPLLSAYISGLPNGGQIVAMSLGGTGAIFVAMSGYALISKRDFSFMSGFLMIGVVVVLIASIANIFFHIAGLQLAISVAAMVIFSALMLVDTSRIINGGETNYIMATIALYLDIYNVFLSLLNITSLGSSDD
jgi:modulator of FtsH protease